MAEVPSTLTSSEATIDPFSLLERLPRDLQTEVGTCMELRDTLIEKLIIFCRRKTLIQRKVSTSSSQKYNKKDLIILRTFDALIQGTITIAAHRLGFHKVEEANAGDYFRTRIEKPETRQEVLVSQLSRLQQLQFFKQAIQNTTRHINDYLEGRTENPPNPKDFNHLYSFSYSKNQMRRRPEKGRKLQNIFNQWPRLQRLIIDCLIEGNFDFRKLISLREFSLQHLTQHLQLTNEKGVLRLPISLQKLSIHRFNEPSFQGNANLLPFIHLRELEIHEGFFLRLVGKRGEIRLHPSVEKLKVLRTAKDFNIQELDLTTLIHLRELEINENLFEVLLTEQGTLRLPDSLQKLKIKKSWKAKRQKSNFTIPASLQTLELPKDLFLELVGERGVVHLPESLQKLTVTYSGFPPLSAHVISLFRFSDYLYIKFIDRAGRSNERKPLKLRSGL